MNPITKEEFEKYLADFAEQPPFTDPDGLSNYDEEKDGEITYGIDHNGDILVQCAVSGRFRKYPHPDVHPGPDA